MNHVLLDRLAPAVISLALLTAAAAANALDAATVRVVLRPGRPDASASTYVDIAVRGTDVPIRLVRRVPGSCTRVDPVEPDHVLVRVACTTTDAAAGITFEVARDGNEIVVRRGVTTEPATDAGGSQDAAPSAQVIARAPLPARATVRVE